MPDPEILRVLTGRGVLSAEGCAPARVRYRLVMERRDAGVRVGGTLAGSHAGLRPIWLQPDATLRLASGRRLDVSVTDLVGDAAEFEATQTVGEDWPA